MRTDLEHPTGILPWQCLEREGVEVRVVETEASRVDLERSSITWVTLHELLGYEDVRNYDGSWTEWGNLIRSPVEVETDDPATLATEG